jgi:Ras GTPase-activating-like protein IQGAP2/3
VVQVYEQMINQIEEETGSLPPNLPRGVPPEVAAANPDVQAIIAPRLTMLMEIANSFLVTIIDSMESVPYGIRWICKQIRSLTRVSVTRRSPLRIFISTINPTSENTQKPRIMLFAH